MCTVLLYELLYGMNAMLCAMLFYVCVVCATCAAVLFVLHCNGVLYVSDLCVLLCYALYIVQGVWCILLSCA